MPTAQRVMAVFTAEPADTQRLADELPFFAPGLRVAVFPDWETLPYDTFSPHQDLISERLATLWRIHSGEVDVVLLPASTALTRIAPPSFLAGTTFQFKQKSRLDEAKLKSQLTLAGYQHVSQVVSPGEYAVRGGLIDLFPMGSLVPYRVDLFGDEVDSIRTFDPDSQRSLYPVPEVRLLPGREFPMDEAARKAFRARWREQIEGDPTRCRVYKDIDTGLASGGIEYYLPLFFDTPGTIFDYLGENAALVLHGKVDEALEGWWKDTRERHRFLQHDPERPILPPASIFMPAEEFFARTQPHATLALRGTEAVGLGAPAARPEHRPRRDRAAGPAGPAREARRPPRAAGGRKRRPPREPARADARQQAQRAGGELTRRIPHRPGEGGHRHHAAGRRFPLARRRGRCLGAVRHRDRTLRHHARGAPSPQAGTDQQRRRADQGPVRAQGGRPRGAHQPRHRAATRA